MPLKAAAAAVEILEPEDMAILSRVFEQLALENDTPIDRETRAAALVRLYQSGLRSEDALLDAMGHDLSGG